MSNVKKEEVKKSIKSGVKSGAKNDVKSEIKKTVKTVGKKNSLKNDEKKDTKKVAIKKNSTNSTIKKKTSVKKDSNAINKPINVNEITLEEAESFYHVSLLVQAVCVIGVLFVSILAIFEHSFTVPIEVLVGVTLLIMAYNNVKLFKRKGFTTIYIVFGILSLIIGILGYFGVTL